MALTTVNVLTAGGGSRVDFVRTVFQKMNGTHGSPFHLAWECTEAYDGTTRSAPAGGLMSNLPGGHLWRPGAVTDPPQGSWIVLRSMGGIVPAKWQLYVTVGSLFGGVYGSVSFGLIPMDDWSVGGGTPSVPALPATLIYNETGHRLGLNPGGNALFVAVDEGMFQIGEVLVGVSSIAGNVGYIGECNPVHPSVTRPFVIQSSWSPTGSPVLALRSPLDDTTLCSATPRQSNLDNGTQEDLPTKYVDGVDLYCTTASHRHGVGAMRYRGLCQEDLVSSSQGGITLGPDGATRTLIALRGSVGGHVYPWDTAVLTNSDGHVIHATLPSTFTADSGGGGAVLHRTLPYLARRLP